MSRAPRIEFEGALYHVMTRRGDRGESIFLQDQDRLRFLEYLEQGADRYGVLVHCYVLMGNHFHLVVTTPKANLSKWMHQLKTAYTVYFNRRHGMVGHLFEGRFKSIVVEAESYLLELSRYLHLNPVRGERLGEGTRNSAARHCAMALRWDLSGLSHREISEMFGIPSSNAVAQMIRRSKEKENRTLNSARQAKS